MELRATGRARRRLIVNRIAEGGAVVAAVLAIAALAVVVWSVGTRGAGALSWAFFTKGPALFGEAGGGIAPALVGTLLLVAIATAIALPVGVFTAIWVTEFAPRRFGNQVRLWLDVLNGFPSIVIGIFAFAFAVKTKVPLLGIGGHQSAIAGGFALSIIMLPLVARSTMEVLALVPNALREASLGLGVARWRTTLAVARAAGETAPLLFTCALAGQLVDWNPTHSVQSIPLTIFQYSESADPNLHQQAWAGAFVLIVFVLVTSLTARVLLDRSRRSR